MILLSPPKILMILVIALIVLGPDKLPSTARRVGAMWSEFKRWRRHLETEVRATFPDLPSTTEIARAVRSPITDARPPGRRARRGRRSAGARRCPHGPEPPGPPSAAPRSSGVRRRAAPTPRRSRRALDVSSMN